MCNSNFANQSHFHEKGVWISAFSHSDTKTELKRQQKDTEASICIQCPNFLQYRLIQTAHRVAMRTESGAL